MAKAVSANGLPRACAIDESGANTAGLKGMNEALAKVSSDRRIRVYRSKYLNNIVEQDHRGVKRRTRPMMGFKSFRSAAATLDGIASLIETCKLNGIEPHAYPSTVLTAIAEGYKQTDINELLP